MILSFDSMFRMLLHPLFAGRALRRSLTQIGLVLGLVFLSCTNTSFSWLIRTATLVLLY